MLATIYARFSSAEQAKGTSIARQLELCTAFAKQHGWQVSDTLKEEGKSGYSGANRSPGGKLYEFEQAVERGQYINGHALIVEHLDRITRQGWEQVLPFLQKLTANGVTVATVDANRIYEAGQRVEMVPVIEAILKSEIARGESENKSKRVREAWKNKRDGAIAGSRKAITRSVPAWIDVDPITREMSLNPGRVVILQRIFQMTINGYGAPKVATQLNDDGVASWKAGGGFKWDASYISKILTNKTVLGEFQPKRATKDTRGKRVNESTGDIIPDYYPQAIDASTYARAIAARRVRRQSGGKWATTANNLLSGIATCGECGSHLIYSMAKKKGVPSAYKTKSGETKHYIAKENISYLYCPTASAKKRNPDGTPVCTNKTFIRYEHYERKLIEYLLGEVIAADAPIQPNDARIGEAERLVDAKQLQLDNLVDSFARTGSAAIERRLLELESELDADKRKLADMKLEQTVKDAAPSMAEQLAAIQLLSADLEDEDDAVRIPARVKVRQHLKALVSEMTMREDKTLFTRIGNLSVTLRYDKASA